MINLRRLTFGIKKYFLSTIMDAIAMLSLDRNFTRKKKRALGRRWKSSRAGILKKVEYLLTLIVMNK